MCRLYNNIYIDICIFIYSYICLCHFMTTYRRWRMMEDGNDVDVDGNGDGNGNENDDGD